MYLETTYQKGLNRLCHRCTISTKPHYLNETLIASYCECENIGGLYLGFSRQPYWKLYTGLDKDDFFTYATSAAAYVDCVKDAALSS